MHVPAKSSASSPPTKKAKAAEGTAFAVSSPTAAVVQPSPQKKVASLRITSGLTDRELEIRYRSHGRPPQRYSIATVFLMPWANYPATINGRSYWVKMKMQMAVSWTTAMIPSKLASCTFLRTVTKRPAKLELL